MKKLVFGLFAMVMFGFVGNAQEKLEGPNFDTDVKVVNPVYSTEGKVKIITITLGRESLHCHRWGVCDVNVLGYDVYKTGQTIAIIQSPKENPYVIVELAEELDPRKFDTDFYVENDVISSEKEVTIVKGIYELDKSIGKFGGYKVLLNLN